MEQLINHIIATLLTIIILLFDISCYFLQKERENNRKEGISNYEV